MKSRYKLALSLLPLVGTATVLSAYTVPAWQEDQEKRQELSDKKKDNDRLLAKLNERSQAEQEQKTLQNQIEELRGAVPKSPDVDLFMLDLDKQCQDSDLDLVAVETPDPEQLKRIESSENEFRELLSENEGKMSIGSKTLEKSEPNSTVKKEGKSSPNPMGLKQLVKQVYVTGSYDGMVRLMKKLESYQRITGIKQVCISQRPEGYNTRSPAGDRAQKLKLSQPVMSFLMTLYYLP